MTLRLDSSGKRLVGMPNPQQPKKIEEEKEELDHKGFMLFLVTLV